LVSPWRAHRARQSANGDLLPETQAVFGRTNSHCVLARLASCEFRVEHLAYTKPLNSGDRNSRGRRQISAIFREGAPRHDVLAAADRKNQSLRSTYIDETKPVRLSHSRIDWRPRG
jgi:hypothetical protein